MCCFFENHFDEPLPSSFFLSFEVSFFFEKLTLFRLCVMWWWLSCGVAKLDVSSCFLSFCVRIKR